MRRWAPPRPTDTQEIACGGTGGRGIDDQEQRLGTLLDVPGTVVRENEWEYNGGRWRRSTGALGGEALVGDAHGLRPQGRISTLATWPRHTPYFEKDCFLLPQAHAGEWPATALPS